MKAALFFALIFFVSCDEVIRPFTNAFLYNVAGKTLPDQCMDSTFDGYMKTLKEQADAQQTTSALVTMINIANHVNSSCPVSDFKEIFDKIAAKVKDPSFITELIAHGIDSLDILIREHNNKEKTPASVGTAIGKAIYPFIKSNNLKRQRKALSSNELSDEIWAVIDGITEGLADGEEFKCKTAVQENREKIGELIEQIKQMIDEGKVRKIS